MRKEINSFIKSHNLPTKIYEMLIYFHAIDKKTNKNKIKISINKNLHDIEFIETLASYFEKELKKKHNVEVRCNLKNIIDELNFAKQYLDDYVD